MNVPLTSLVPAGVDDRATTWATLVAAFAADPAVRNLYPDEDGYHAHFPGFAEALGGRAFDAGFVDLYPAGFGAALWLPPGVAPDGDRIVAHLAATLPPARLQAMAAGFEAQAALHPREPHWYLPWIGVRPQLQGAGIGSTLLRQGLARVDADGMPAYLEATDRRNAALYARHGFQVTGIVLAPGYPQIITMWRPARAR